MPTLRAKISREGNWVMACRKWWTFSMSLVIGGCSSSSAPMGDPGAACMPNLEATVRTQGLVSNGTNLNGTDLNGTDLNGTNLNGTNLNGTNLNGTNLNGVQLNGTNLNGTNLNGVNLRGTLLQGIRDDGRIVSGADVVGANLTGVLSNAHTIELTVTGFAAEGDLAYYVLEAAGQPICPAGGRGLFVPGVWDSAGGRHDTMAIGGHEFSVSYSCTEGAIGKCVVWGYDPSKVGPDLHQSCTRMVRADYCGTGVSFTKDGTLIDVFDTRGVQQPTTGDASLAFEAAWTTSGAACVNRPRYDTFAPSGAPVLPSCWARLPKCGSWSEAESKSAILGNSSRVQSLRLCE
jgi:hypothetical protein